MTKRRKKKNRRGLRALGVWLCILLLLFGGMRALLLRLFPFPYRDTLEQWAAVYNVDPALAAAVVYAESHFDPDARSTAGAVGLMQLTGDTFDWLQSKLPEHPGLTPKQLTDPEINLRFGIFNLSLLQAEFSHVSAVLAGYNAGRTRAREWLANPEYSEDGVSLQNVPYAETRGYIKRVNICRILYEWLYF